MSADVKFFGLVAITFCVIALPVVWMDTLIFVVFGAPIAFFVFLAQG